MTDWPTATHVARPETGGDVGKLVVVGIGPGVPDHLTQAAREAIRDADAVYAARLYQRFLERDNLLSGSSEDENGPDVLDSSRRELTTQARESFERVRAGETVVHVSGGDPTVYGKSDLLVGLAETEAECRIPIEVLPGVTAALGGAATLGAPLSTDFCALSLSTQHRNQAEIDRKLDAAAAAGLVIALYNVRGSLSGALSVIRDHRPDSVPIAVLEDVSRGDSGRNPAGETVDISPLGAEAKELSPQTPGAVAIVGTEDSTVFRPAGGGRPFLVTPRGDEPLFHDHS